MVLISFDIIESQLQPQQLYELEQEEQLLETIGAKFTIDPKYIEISGGDQLRVLLSDYQYLFELILFIYTRLNQKKLKARVFISKGQLQYNDNTQIGAMAGEIFYKNKKLENKIKESKYLVKENSIYYDGFAKSREINLLLISFSQLIIFHSESLEIIYQYYYQNKTQSQIANEMAIGQSTVTKRLKKANYLYYQDFDEVICQLIKED